MPSPVGHALAGISVVYAADIATGRRSSPRFVAVCAGLAMFPDIDLVWPGAHRTATHSVTAAVTAAALTFIVAAGVTGKVTHVRPERWRTATIAGLAYATHLLLDWLGADNFAPYGIQLFWPWSDRWFISNLDVFDQTARRHFLSAPIIQQNLVAVARELAILLPIVVVLASVRVKAAPRLASEVAGGDHPPQ